MTQLQGPVPAAAFEADPPPNDAPLFSPLWWVAELEKELAARQLLVQLLENYADGHHRIHFQTARYRKAFAEMLNGVSDNWMALTLRAMIERLHIQGFRFGDELEGDDDAWEIWQRNKLDVDAPLAFNEAAKHGESYLLTWPEQVPGTFGRFFRRRSQLLPRITAEHPSQVIVRREAGDRRRRAAALKKWVEDDGTMMATLWLPDAVYRFQRASKDGSKWEPRTGVEFTNKHDFGVVPVVPLVHDPQMLPSYAPPSLGVGRAAIGLGRSRLIDVLSTQDQITKLLCDMMVASEFAAFQQRWATGLEVLEDEDGKAIEPLDPGVDRLWVADRPEASFGAFPAYDFSGHIKGIESRLQSLASRKRIPLHYLLGQSGQFPSGESLKATETGLVASCEDAQGPFGEGCEESIQLGGMVTGNRKIAEQDAGETVWADAESRTESEHIDSLVKKLAFGVPFQQLWEDAGYSQTQIKRFRQMLREVSINRATDGQAFPAAAELPAGDPPPPPGGDPSPPDPAAA